MTFISCALAIVGDINQSRRSIGRLNPGKKSWLWIRFFFYFSATYFLQYHPEWGKISIFVSYFHFCFVYCRVGTVMLSKPCSLPASNSRDDIEMLLNRLIPEVGAHRPCFLIIYQCYLIEAQLQTCLWRSRWYGRFLPSFRHSSSRRMQNTLFWADRTWLSQSLTVKWTLGLGRASGLSNIATQSVGGFNAYPSTPIVVSLARGLTWWLIFILFSLRFHSNLV